ncbi:hypothetical protein ACH5RR_006857 [Cinchona calisaya]|uniref:Uncharacterized protein n=1 Tax=Cinchona calisaya TaxID=153742 RepID=A0ABD3AQ88_9GENT
MPIIEARSIEDIEFILKALGFCLKVRTIRRRYLDLKQSHKVRAERNMLSDSVHGGLHVGEFDSERTCWELPVVEKISPSALSFASKQALAHQKDKVLQSSAEFEENEAGTSRHL